MTNASVSCHTVPAVDTDPFARLTPKERDCLRAIGRGISTEQIAVELSISAGRAANLIKGVRAKLGGVDRYTAAARFRAYEQGLSGDVPAKDLAPPPAAPPFPQRRPDAGTVTVREERATFDWQGVSYPAPARPQRPGQLWTVVGIAALVVLLGACVSLALPMSEGVQHLANLIAPPRH